MSYISHTLRGEPAAHTPAAGGYPDASRPAVLGLNRANTRFSEALEAAVLLATLSGLSLVLSTVAAGAF